jgi:hypothetical protein
MPVVMLIPQQSNVAVCAIEAQLVAGAVEPPPPA